MSAKPPEAATRGDERVADVRFDSERLIVDLADGMPAGPDVTFTVTYHRGPSQHPEGTLTAGDSVKVREGMVFNVTPTNKS